MALVDGSGGDKTPADQVVDECKKHGVKAMAQYGDVSKFADAEAAVKACVNNFGRIDILCNIAGIDKPKMIWNMTEQEWDQVVGVHMKGTFNFMRNAAPFMREQKFGRIINCHVGSLAGWRHSSQLRRGQGWHRYPHLGRSPGTGTGRHHRQRHLPAGEDAHDRRSQGARDGGQAC